MRLHAVVDGMFGARVVKTAIAVTAAIGIAQYLDLYTFQFAGIVAVLAVQPSIYRSLRNAVQLTVSAIIAAWLGAVALFTLGGVFYAMGLVAFLLMILHVKIRWTNSLLVAVVVGINTMGTIGLDFKEAAWNQMALVVIGTLTGTLVNLVRRPVHQERAEVVLRQSESMLRVLANFLLIDLERNRITPYELIRAQVAEIGGYIKRGKDIAAYVREDRRLRRQTEAVDTAAIFQSFERMLSCLDNLSRSLAGAAPVPGEMTFLRKALQLAVTMQSNVTNGKRIHSRGFARVLERKREHMWRELDGTEDAAVFLAYYNAYEYVQQYVRELSLFLAGKEGLDRWLLTYTSVDRPGLLAEVSAVLQRHGLNIIQVTIKAGGNFAQTTMEVTSRPDAGSRAAAARVADHVSAVDDVLKAEMKQVSAGG